MTQAVSPELIERLQKVMNLQNSSSEGEAAAAVAMLQKLLQQYNLDISSLEKKGRVAPAIGESPFDLGKAAFVWKLKLAEAVAGHFYCYPMVSYQSKTVAFIGRPDNVESLRMLYAWLIDQIKRISAEERKLHESRTSEHVDPLRWQVNFGRGAAGRIGDRLAQVRDRRGTDEDTTALVLHHDAEISDYLEETRGYRVDGQMTKKDQERQERWNADKALLAADPEAYYTLYPYRRPVVVTAEEQAKWDAAEAKRLADWMKREERNAKRRTGRTYTMPSSADIRKEEQAHAAKQSGYRAGERVNLNPFLGTNGSGSTPQIGV